jgi:hypothetical protein
MKFFIKQLVNFDPMYKWAVYAKGDKGDAYLVGLYSMYTMAKARLGIYKHGVPPADEEYCRIWYKNGILKNRMDLFYSK